MRKTYSLLLWYWGGLYGGFIHAQAPTNFIHKHLLQELATATKELYIFPKKGEQLARQLLIASQQTGFDHLEGALLADSLTKWLRLQSGDHHLGVLYTSVRHSHSTEVPRRKEIQLVKEQRRPSNSLEDDHGFEQIQQLPGNIGYLNYTRFMDVKSSKPLLEQTMQQLASTKALIIDLRTNHGGYVDMLLLFCSYFFEKRQTLSKTYYRYERWTASDKTVPIAPRKKYLHKPIYLLTSTQTASAAEALCYHLQQHGLATVVGEMTAGLANPVEMLILKPRFWFFVPVGEIKSTLTGKSWEQTGIVPDFFCPANQALAQAQVTILTRLLASKDISVSERAILQQQIKSLEQSIEQ